MMTPKTQTIVAISTIALTVGVALALIPMKSEASAVVLGMMAVFIVVWNGAKLIAKRKCSDSDWMHSKARHEILFAIILATLLLLGSSSATLAKELAIFDGDLVKRIVGVNIGLMLVILGNYMPKKLTQTADSCCPAAKSASMQRFVGWTFVLAGLFYAVVWMVVDLERTSFVVLFSFPVAIAVVVIARMSYLKLSNAKDLTKQSV